MRDIMRIPRGLSLLLGAARAGLSLKIVRLGVVEWRLLQAIDFDLAEIKDALKSTRCFEINIDTSWDEDEEEPDYVKNHRLWHLIKDSKQLENLFVAL